MPQARSRRKNRFRPYPMTNVEGEEVDDFISSGRVGRRNALPDILDSKHAETTTANLPETLAKLTCSDDDETSKSDCACADKKDQSEAEAPCDKDTKDAKSKKSDTTKKEKKES